MDEFMRQLHIVSIERRPEACLGCGFEHRCSTHGCAVIKTASEQLKAYRATKHTPEECTAAFTELDTLKRNPPVQVESSVLELAMECSKLKQELAAYRAADIWKIVCFMMARNAIKEALPENCLNVIALMTIKSMPDMLQMEECRKLLAAAEAALKEQEANDGEQ